MQSNIRMYVTIVTVLLVVAAGVYMFAKTSRAFLPNGAGTSGDTGVSTSTSTGTSTNMSAGSSNLHGATSTTVSLNIPAPKNYGRSLVFAADIPAAARTKMQAEFDADVAQIAKDNDLNAWSDIAVLRRITSDYQAEAGIWTYLSKRYPTLPGFYIELGDVYANYLKDYPQAEADYLKAISLDPKNPDVYIDLYNLYKAYPKTNTAAEDILKQGIAANPGVFQLNLTLARYYAAIGRTEDAKVQYNAAIAAANAQKQTAAAAQIQAEENGL